MLVEIPDVLNQAEWRQCRAVLEAALWQDGRATAGAVASQVKHNQQLPEDDPRGLQMGGFIVERLAGIERFMAAALPFKILPPRFNRYAGGGHYGDHIDNAIFSVPGTAQRIRSDLSATLFLAEPDEYDGGELVIGGAYGGRRVKLPAGHMLLYSAATLHHVTPVTRGARYAAFFWMQSLVRDDARRAMLLGLDDDIRQLAQEAPGSSALPRLTSLYQNLLRQWSEL